MCLVFVVAFHRGRVVIGVAGNRRPEPLAAREVKPADGHRHHAPAEYLAGMENAPDPVRVEGV